MLTTFFNSIIYLNAIDVYVSTLLLFAIYLNFGKNQKIRFSLIKKNYLKNYDEDT